MAKYMNAKTGKPINFSEEHFDQIKHQGVYVEVPENESKPKKKSKKKE